MNFHGDRLHKEDEDVLFLAHIGAVGDDGAHAQRQGEETLAHGIGEGARREFAPVRMQQVADTLPRSGQADRIDQDDHNQHEKHRKRDLAELLDAGAHAAGDHGHRQPQEKQVHQHRQPGRRDELAEQAADGIRIHTGKTIQEIDAATAFDNYMNAEQSVAFGLCDEIRSSLC